MRARRRTSLEQAVADALRAFPHLEIKEQARVGKYRVDLLIGSLIVEVDGSWTHSSPMDRWKDACRDQKLRDWGYEVVHLTEAEIKEVSPLGLVQRLDELLRHYEHAALVPRRHRA